MPGVWNINSVYNVGAKKLSSKLTFEVGERFSGRIIKLAEGKGEFTIKLLDGWQFIAQLQEELTPEQLEGLLKFQVLGFEDGKLKLKLVKQDDEKARSDKDPLQALIKSQGLAKEEIDTLKHLVKFNIPLTRENIARYSSIFHFNEKIKGNENEANSFIDNYILSKNIPKDSKEAINIKEKLQSFFKEFKNLEPQDILTFVENDIDITESNIKAFNKLFKNGESIEKILLKSPVEGKLVNEENSINNMIVKNISDSNKEVVNKDIKSILPKEAYTSAVQDKKINVLDMLKKISGNTDETDKPQIEIMVEDNNSENKNMIDGNSLKNDIVSYFTKNNITKVQLETKDVKELINILKNEGFTVSDDEVVEFKNAFSQVLEEDSIVQAEEVSKEIVKSSQEQVKQILKEKSLEIKDIIKEIIMSSKEVKDEGEIFNKILDFIKGNANEVKVFNSLSNNYYLMDVPLKIKDNEYECKLIVKDQRGKGKKIDSSNIKMIVSVKTVVLGNVDAYINLQEKNLYIDLKCSKEYIKTFEKEKDKLSKSLNKLGYSSKIIVSRAIEEVNISTSREFFNSSNLVILDRKV